MIQNMHIRKDYATWGITVKEKARLSTMCGKITLSKFVGVPGATPGQHAVVTEDGNYGWCLTCCQVYVVEVRMLARKIADTGSPDLATAYMHALRDVTTQLDMAHMSLR